MQTTQAKHPYELLSNQPQGAKKRISSGQDKEVFVRLRSLVGSLSIRSLFSGTTSSSSRLAGWLHFWDTMSFTSHIVLLLLSLVFGDFFSTLLRYHECCLLSRNVLPSGYARSPLPKKWERHCVMLIHGGELLRFSEGASPFPTRSRGWRVGASGPLNIWRPA